MGKKLKIILLIILGVLIVGYFGAKAFLLFNIPEEDEFIKNVELAFKNKETITIKESQEEVKDYLVYKEMKIRNDFDLVNESSNMYKIKNTDIAVAFNKEAIDSLVTYIEKESKNNGLHYDLTKDLEKNNVDTNFKLYEYFLSNRNLKLNIFSSFNSLRKVHTILGNFSLVFRNIDKVILIDGDYDGYILESGKVKTAFIINDNYLYEITINSEYSNTDFINLISTIRFD